MILFTKKSDVYVDISNQKSRVQDIRLFAALIEAGWNLEVNLEQSKSLKSIRAIKIADKSNKREVKLDFLIDHCKPSTNVSGISAELIFPEWFFDGFDVDKEDIVIFEGLVTRQRIKYLVKLLGYGAIREKLSLLIYNISRRYGGFFISRLLSKANVKVNFSYNGRKKEFKLYDKSYFLNLSQSKYVICPPGDFVWTYRFFETMMSKSIPIINHEDEYIKKYGFITKTFDEIKYLSDVDYKNITQSNFDIVKEIISKKYLLESLLETYKVNEYK